MSKVKSKNAKQKNAKKQSYKEVLQKRWDIVKEIVNIFVEVLSVDLSVTNQINPHLASIELFCKSPNNATDSSKCPEFLKPEYR